MTTADEAKEIPEENPWKQWLKDLLERGERASFSTDDLRPAKPDAPRKRRPTRRRRPVARVHQRSDGVWIAGITLDGPGGTRRQVVAAGVTQEEALRNLEEKCR